MVQLRGLWGNLMKALLDNRLKLKCKARFILTDINTGEVEITKWHKNIVPYVGKQAMIRRLGNIGLKSNESIITYGAVGTGTTPPQSIDTKLDVEIYRKINSLKSYSGLAVTVRTYYDTTEANGDLKEYGLFGEDATGAADSGTIFQRVLINKTKTTAKTLTVESILEIS